MTDDELKAIEARANAATPGPWEIREVLPHAIYQQGERGYHTSTVDSEIDAQFIAHSRIDIPALVAALRSARAEVQRLTIENEHMFERQVEWATEHPVYQTSKKLEAELRAAREQNADLQTALQFYGSKSNYELKMRHASNPIIHHEWESSDVQDDEGKLARKALAASASEYTHGTPQANEEGKE